MHNLKKILLLMDLDRGWTRGLLAGIAKYSKFNSPSRTYRLSQFYWRPEHKRGKDEIKRLKEWKADGIITREMDHIGDILKLGVPVVGSEYSGRKLPIPIIKSDTEETGRIAADYFFERGFRSFAYCGYSDTAWSTRRLEGFEKTLKEKGFEVMSYMKPIANLRQLWISEINNMAQWLETLPPSTALMTCSDDRSLHVLEACKVASILVPEEIAILGVDDDEILCELANPPLSSIAFNTEYVGYMAASMLDSMMNGEKPKTLEIVAKPTYVVSRQSTDVFAVEDKELNKALSYIRNNRLSLIGVSDVVKATNVSRRNLELRFQKQLGRSILNEIRRVHIGQMAEMLIETNYPVAKVAAMLGHSTVENICRYFKKEKGLTPSEYREKYRDTD